MKSAIHATKRQRNRAGSTEAARSNAEQIDRAENEGMTIRAKNSLAKRRKRQSVAETTSLERRVLAHERILQSLIAHMTETNPSFLKRLRETYQIQIKYHEQDYTDTDDFAEQFVRAVGALVLREHDNATEQASAARQVRATPVLNEDEVNKAKLDRFQIRNRCGIWEVKEYGRFMGDYFSEEKAIKAIGFAKQNR